MTIRLRLRSVFFVTVSRSLVDAGVTEAVAALKLIDLLVLKLLRLRRIRKLAVELGTSR